MVAFPSAPCATVRFLPSCPSNWFAFDPTNMKPANDSHFAVARGRQYSDVAPLRGVFEGHAKARLEVTVEVARLE